MAEEVVLMKGNEAIAHAVASAVVPMDTSDILLLRNRRCWKLLPN